MADPKVPLNPVTVHFIDTSPTVSQSVPVTAANPLPVTLASGATDQDVNLVSAAGVAVSAAAPLPVSIGGVVAAATITSVNSLATNQTLKAALSTRRGLIIVNTDANALYIKYGATATTAGGGYTAIIGTGGYWEMPQPIYTGIIDGIWAADGSGLAEITEL